MHLHIHLHLDSRYIVKIMNLKMSKQPTIWDRRSTNEIYLASPKRLI